jgi:hypothetical protein
MLYINQLFLFFSNQFFNNLILIRFKGIEANYLYIYPKKFTLKLVIGIFFTLHGDMKPCDTKRQMTTTKNKMM